MLVSPAAAEREAVKENTSGGIISVKRCDPQMRVLSPRVLLALHSWGVKVGDARVIRHED